MKRLRIAILVVILLVVGYPVWIGVQVWSQSHQDELHSADAIVVLGAAQYDGEPSPVFKARLDQAAYLYNEGFSATVIVTGGKQPGDRFTEAGAGEAYLASQGIPSDDILGEDEGNTTLESLEQVREIAEDNDVESVLVVSDPLHSERLKRISGDLGFEAVYASPASYVDLNRSRITKAKELMHEVGSIILYQLIDRW